ncbi:hypothetical protein QBZ16_003245 [Prototheca wickerhamii]|uniref:Ubiquitin carboxyl-terminal hydrolase n=1 Tax=Prototheca wickerhamii TaxID=3111 RepID=A0AAD9MKN7_PROWI|nr:hypothetical protein QBZ16_003245 [Prototheca wickerhamii]
MTDFMQNLGADTRQFKFTDVWGLDPVRFDGDRDLLAMIEGPVLAVILLFPIGDAKGEDTRLGTPVTNALEGPYYMKQTIQNACGTIAVLHAVLNNRDFVASEPDSFLDKFYTATKDMDPESRGAFLENPPSGDLNIETCHKAAALAGSTAPPAAADDVDLHFVAFVHSGGRLFELDGRQRGPIDHSATSLETLLQDTAETVKRTRLAGSDSLNFSLIALSARGDE